MDELRKVRRVAEKGAGRVTETLLVIDATTGQNGLAQAREFGEATQVTGVVLTKLDGSAKGGIVFAIETELGIPIKLVGVGETIGDLVAFEPDRVRRRPVRRVTPRFSTSAGTAPGRPTSNQHEDRTTRRARLDPVVRLRDPDARGLRRATNPCPSPTDPTLPPPVAVNIVGSGGDIAEAAAPMDRRPGRERTPDRRRPQHGADARLRRLRVRSRRGPAGTADELDRLPLPGRCQRRRRRGGSRSPPRSA